MEEKNETHPLHFFLLLLGGLSLGAGILNLYWSFGFSKDGGVTRTGLNQDFATTGFSGIDNIQLMNSADFAIPLVVIGVCCMVFANATAWRQTDGY